MPRIRQDPGACVCMCAASRDLRLLWKCDVVYGLEANRGQEDCRCGKERPGFRARMVLFVKKRLYEMTAIQMSTRALLIAADMFMFSVQMLVCCSFLSHPSFSWPSTSDETLVSLVDAVIYFARPIS